MRRRRASLTFRGARTWRGHAAGRSLVFASIVLFKFGSPRWGISEPTATPTGVILGSDIRDNFMEEGVIIP